MKDVRTLQLLAAMAGHGILDLPALREKPPRELTERDHERIRAAEERRQRRA